MTSEIGRLRRVLVHEPGPEVDRMVPAMMEQLLFDDILYGDRARDEHGRFRRVLQLCGVEVIEADDLLAQALGDPEARRGWIEALLRSPGGATDEDRSQLEGMDGQALAQLLVSGSRPRPHPASVNVEDLYRLPPLPNWCFQRDPQVVLGDGVIFASMATAAREREALLTRTLFRFHPALSATPVLFDPHDGAGAGGHLEGGDVLVLSSEVVAIGLSERTNREAVGRLARALCRRARGPRWLLAVAIPRRRAYMHLDTLITPVDRDACLVFPPVILDGGIEQAEVYEMDLHAADPELYCTAPLLERLARHSVELEPIPCGGDDPVAQQREQWTDGANALALAPGVITLYDRNTVTAETLSRHGFRIIEAEDLLLGREELDVDGGRRACILISSHEMSRARGGPHCLVHPLLRDRL